MSLRGRMRRWAELTQLPEARRALAASRAALGWHVRRGDADARLVARYLASEASPGLHLGCGGHLLPGWLNADLRPPSREVLHLDATRRFELLPDGSFAHVFTEHLIEHLRYADGLTMLGEARRVLRPGGRIRVSTPDLAFLLALHDQRPSELQLAYLAWSRASYAEVEHAEPAFVHNNFVRDWGHRFIYDEPTLRRALEQAGFTAITRHALGESEDPRLRGLENAARMPAGFLALETFTLEGIRAG